MSWKGLLLAGGTGSRLHPLTLSINKHVLPIFDKPMIYYSLSTLMLADIREIVIVSTPSGVEQIRRLLGDGHKLGLAIDYVVQQQPAGIAEALVLARTLLEGHSIALILGDNVFFGSGLETVLTSAKMENTGATIFGYDVADPSAYGVVTLENGSPAGLVEKPLDSKSHMAVTGLYLYEKGVLDIAGEIRPSARGEYEITDVNRRYLETGKLHLRGLGRGTVWLDAGTPADLFAASQFVHIFQTRTGLKIAAPEELSFRKNYISRDEFSTLIEDEKNSEYRDYLVKILDEGSASSYAIRRVP